MGTIRSYRDLTAWQKSYALVLMVYEVTQRFPKLEQFGLPQQLRRASVSVPSNIAEGWGRKSRVDYVRFLKMARGSMYEVQTQLSIASDLGFMTQEHEIHELAAESERVLNGLIRALENSETVH